jgi:mono/diheme cytochrome c family protein
MRVGKFRLLGVFIPFVIVSIVLVACGDSKATLTSITDRATESVEEHDDGEDQDQDERINAEVPEEYEDLTNPLAGNSEVISSGSKLFIANCAMCHGESGEGDGPASAGLDPKPAALSDGEMLSDLSDAYLYWRIAEGGSADPFNSAMPAWKSIFGDEQIWQLVTFIRSLSN